MTDKCIHDIVATKQLYHGYNYWKEATINQFDRDVLARSISQFRRATLREFIFNILRSFGDFDFSLPQIATLLLLDEEQGEPTVKQIAELLGRSLSTTSRMLEQLVARGLISRREDTQDRRSKRVAITESGRAFVATLERQRAEAQLAVMEYLPPEERADVARAMVLLADAGKRRQVHEHSISESEPDITVANPQSE